MLKKYKKLLTDLVFVPFRLLWSPFLVLFSGVVSSFRILLPKKEPKMGPNNPENQRNPKPLIVSKHLSQYARHFFSGTLLSRISGMIRDISMAAMFGDHPSVAAFMIAFRFSHFLRRLLGEGALQSIFIPHYEEIKLQDENKAKVFFFRLSLLLSALLAVIVLVVEGGVGWALWQQSLPRNEVLQLFAWMFPSLFFICLYGLNISLLQCHHSFFLSSFAPFVCNVVWISAIFLFAQQEISQAMINLAIFIVIGFFIQWLITFLKTCRTFLAGMKSIESPIFAFPKEMRSVGKATLFGLIGVAAVQFNSFIDMVFAHYADLKGPVYLWYAIRLQQLPLALIGFSCVYSIVPSLSRLIKAKTIPEAQDLYFFGRRRICLLLIPCTVAIFALGFPSVNLLFGRGHFSELGVIETTWCLWAYALSLLPATLTIYQASLFYAYGDFKSPMIASIASVIASITWNAAFVFLLDWGAISIALSTSLSAAFNYVFLKNMFIKKAYWNDLVSQPLACGKLVIVSVIAFASCMLCDRLFFHAFFYQYDVFVTPRALREQLTYFLIQLVVFAGTFSVALLAIQKELFIALKNRIFQPEG